MDYPNYKLDIEIYSDCGKTKWAQRMFLSHGYNDVLWTNNIKEVVSFIEESLENIKKQIEDDKMGKNKKELFNSQ